MAPLPDLSDRRRDLIDRVRTRRRRGHIYGTLRTITAVSLIGTPVTAYNESRFQTTGTNTFPFTGACSAAGRAPPWHGGGQGFESPQVHQYLMSEIENQGGTTKKPFVPRGWKVFYFLDWVDTRWKAYGFPTCINPIQEWANCFYIMGGRNDYAYQI